MDQINLTVAEAAAFLRIGRTTLYEMARKNEVPHTRIGRKILFHKPTIEKWLLDATVQPDKKVGGNQ